MTALYVKSKIEAKAKTLTNHNCFIPYCIKAFGQYLTENEIIDTVNKIAAKQPKKSFRSHFHLSN